MNALEDQFKYLKIVAKACRDAQKKFVRTRNSDDLKSAKEAGKQLDDYLMKIDSQQMKLDFERK